VFLFWQAVFVRFFWLVWASSVTDGKGKLLSARGVVGFSIRAGQGRVSVPGDRGVWGGHISPILFFHDTSLFFLFFSGVSLLSCLWAARPSPTLHDTHDATDAVNDCLVDDFIAHSAVLAHATPDSMRWRQTSARLKVAGPGFTLLLLIRPLYQRCSPSTPSTPFIVIALCHWEGFCVGWLMLRENLEAHTMWGFLSHAQVYTARVLRYFIRSSLFHQLTSLRCVLFYHPSLVSLFSS
jgi:hypothetical protein